MGKDNNTLFSKLFRTLTKTRQAMVEKVHNLVLTSDRVDESLFEELEEILILSDVGVVASRKLITDLKDSVQSQKIGNSREILPVLKSIVEGTLSREDAGLQLPTGTPGVIMMVGVNGSGKTTTIGKRAYKFKLEGKKVVIGAADTFRAAAIEQVKVWADRSGAELISHKEGGDPAAVAYDATEAGIARNADVVIIDTAGRLHTKVNLMEELKKTRRVISSRIMGAPHETLLVLDSTTGQNAIQQARVFSESVQVTGIVLTKLDGTSKGGVILAIYDQLGIPVKLVGVGEGIEDLNEFNAEVFTNALFPN